MDVLTAKQRSYNMSRIKRSHTIPELKLKKPLRILGFAHQPNGIYGNPDFANKKAKIVIFIDGCFWHGCLEHYTAPKSRKSYWIPKIRKNMERDRQVNKHLRSTGWRVIRVWEHSVNQL